MSGNMDVLAPRLQQGGAKRLADRTKRYAVEHRAIARLQPDPYVAPPHFRSIDDAMGGEGKGRLGMAGSKGAS